MMKKLAFLPITIMAFAAACADTPTVPVSDSPLLAKGGGGNPHFVSASVAVTSGAELAISFKEAGLSSGTVIHYEYGAYGTGEWACINGGGKNPKASNKRQVGQPLQGAADITVEKNGNITATVNLGPPVPPADWSCPSGQRAELLWVSYEDIQLSDTSNGLAAFDPPASVSRIFYNL